MAFANKYRLTFKDHFQVQWTAYIQVNNYAGAVTDLIGNGSNPLNIVYEAGEYFAFTPIKPSYVEFNLVELTHDAYSEFFTLDRSAKVKIYKASDLFWQGWMIADDYGTLYNVAPKYVSFIAVDGLSMLKNYKLPITNMGGPDKYLVKQYFKEAFDYINLGCNTYESFAITYLATENFFNDMSIDSWAFYENEEYLDMYTILEDILSSFGARLYQKNGCWYIDHITQMEEAEVTYKLYDSGLTYQSSAAQTLNKDITSASGSPLLVPINHTLRKENDRPYSYFKLNVDYRLNKNLIRYPEGYTVVDNAVTELSGDKLLYMAETIQAPFYKGVTYNLGYVELSNQYTNPFTLRISGKLAGYLKVKLYILNIADNKKYFYSNYDIILGGGVTAHAAKLWRPNISVIPGNWNTSVDVLRLEYTNETELRYFSETVDIYKEEPNQVLKGTLFLIINSPYDTNGGLCKTYIDLNNITLDYNECKLAQTYTEGSISAYPEYSKVYNQRFYSNPYFYHRAPGWTAMVAAPYQNPQCAYPGLIYHDPNEDMIYEPVYKIRYRGGVDQTIERFMFEQIYYLYGTLRNRVLGTLLGAMDFGTVLDYDSIRYIPVYWNFNVKRAFNEVCLLQLTQLGDFLLNEDGTYILDEDGNKIKL